MSGDIEFRVYKEKGIVVCKIHENPLIAMERIRKYTNNFKVHTYQYLIDSVYVGVARCAPEDEFDEEKGKKVALTKAKAKRCRAVNNAINKYIKDQTRKLEILKEYGIHQIPDVKELGY